MATRGARVIALLLLLAAAARSKSSKKHRTEELVKQSQQDPPLIQASEIDGLVAAAEPDIQATCRDLLIDRCVVGCYGPGI